MVIQLQTALVAQPAWAAQYDHPSLTEFVTLTSESGGKEWYNTEL